MTDAQEAAAVAAGGPILHIPMTFGAVAVVYNLPGIATGQLKLDGPTLADIYLGNIKKWDDAEDQGAQLRRAPAQRRHRRRPPL